MSELEMKKLADEEIVEASGGVIPDGDSDDWLLWDRDVT